MTEPTTCERCQTRPATMLLGKGLLICGECYQPPEDVVRKPKMTNWERRQIEAMEADYPPDTPEANARARAEGQTIALDPHGHKDPLA